MHLWSLGGQVPGTGSPLASVAFPSFPRPRASDGLHPRPEMAVRGSGHSRHSLVVVTMQVSQSKFGECGRRAPRKDSSHGRGAPLLPFLRGSVLGDPCTPNSSAGPTFVVGGGVGRGLALWAEFVPSPGLIGPRAPHPVPWLLHPGAAMGRACRKGVRAVQACLGGQWLLICTLVGTGR